MQPLRIRIERIVDFGTIVSLVGVDIETAKPVVIHIDHGPFAAFWTAWWGAGLPQPVEYAADRLMLHLNMLPADDADEVRLTGHDNTGTATPNDDQQPVREIER